jgi:hypothetical protein
MNNVIHFNLGAENLAPESDGVALVECVQKTIEEFGEMEFALTLLDRHEHLAKAA